MVEPEQLIVDAIFMSEETHFYVNEKLHPIIVTVTNQHH